jgi:hypothetical protein
MIRATPFQPFTIRLADGREVLVSHPEAIAYNGGRTVLVALPNDSFEIIDLLLVSSLPGSLNSPTRPA